MITLYEIPLIAAPQTFAVTLAGVLYGMRLMYHEANAGVADMLVGADPDDTSKLMDSNRLDAWGLDIYDRNNNPIICGLPLITGIDLLYQHRYLGIGGALLVSVDGDVDGLPDFTSLGTTTHLYFYVP